MSFLMTEEIKEKWQPIVEAEGVAPIKDAATRNALIQVLENTVQEAGESPTSTGSALGAAGSYASNGSINPVLIGLVRRAMPAMIANDLLGVQPMSMPTGLIFAMRSYKTNAAGSKAETFVPGSAPVDAGTVSSASGEVLGSATQVAGGASDPASDPVVQGSPWAEVSFSITKTSVTAETRAMKATYTQELAQDLKAQHGLDAETELANLLTSEIVAEMNREVLSIIGTAAITETESVAGSAIAVAGEYDVDVADGRWAAEKYRMLAGYIDRVANRIAQNTGRGKGNYVVTSSRVAQALQIAGVVSAAPVAVALNGDVAGVSVSLVGSINGGSIKVYVDQFQTDDTVTVGYKGGNVYDAGAYYCPYIPLTMMKAVGEDDFQPRIGFKSRYGIVENPFSGGAGANDYFRKFVVKNLDKTI
jgi:hypothetical protein